MTESTMPPLTLLQTLLSHSLPRLPRPLGNPASVPPTTHRHCHHHAHLGCSAYGRVRLASLECRKGHLFLSYRDSDHLKK